MVYTIKKFLPTLEKKSFAPFYCLYGDEEYYLEYITQYIINHTLSSAQKTLNLTIFYGKECTLSQVFTQIRRLPIMAPKQVVVVKNAQELKYLQKEIGYKTLENYLDNILFTTIFILVYAQPALDKRKKIYHLIIKNAIVVESKKLWDYQVQDFIISYVQGKEYIIDKLSIMLLYSHLGNNLHAIVQALEKLFLHLPIQSTITTCHVEKYVGISRIYTVFELQKYLIYRKKDMVYSILNQYMGKDPKSQVITTIAYFFQFFCKTFLLYQHSEKSPTQLAKILRVHPYFLDDYILGAKHYSIDKIINNIHHLHEADLQIKNIGFPIIPEHQILRTLFFKIMSE